jgi:pimeloyl-ACP methyl ester carboxylesterase
MSSVTSKDGTTIAFDKLGSGPAVILVDGALGYRAQWGSVPLAKLLADHFTVYTYDRRGRGESGDTSPYTPEREIEDLEALIDDAGSSAFVYGSSGGAVLGLKAAAQLGASKIPRLAIYEPPYSTDDYRARAEFAQYVRQTNDLLAAGQRGDVVALFLEDMMPPDMIDQMRQSPEWGMLEAVAPTLAYDNALLGDSTVPVETAQAVTVPTLVMEGETTMDFIREITRTLVQALPNAQHKVLKGQTHGAEPEAVAPALIEFFSA